MRAVPGRADSAAVANVPRPAPTEDEYLVESILIGLCGSDSELLHRDQPAKAPLTIGHESLGRIVSTPESGNLQEGDLVVGTIRRSCSTCPGCNAGRFDLCEQRVVRERGLFAIDGFGSDVWVASEASLIPVPETLGESGVLVEPLSSLVKARRRLREAMPASHDHQYLVTGAGPIGLLAALLLSVEADRIVVVDPQPPAGAERAAGALRAVELVDSWENVQDHFDAVFECSGSPAALATAVSYLRHGGFAVLEGIPSAGSSALPPSALARAVFRDLTMIGTVNASIQDHHDAATALSKAPQEFLRPFLRHQIQPDDWPAWASAVDARALKTTVRFAQ